LNASNHDAEVELNFDRWLLLLLLLLAVAVVTNSCCAANSV
jgi:hypothetical protein